MKVQLTNKNVERLFKQIETGSTFMYNNNPYMKVSGAPNSNAVCFHTGKLQEFCLDCKVEPRTMKVVDDE